MPQRKGLGEEPSPFDDQTAQSRAVSHTRLKIDNAGRIVIPAEMRLAMMAKPGDVVVAQVVEGELRVLSRSMILDRIRAQAERFREANPGVSVVDELIAERRAEARRELEEANAWRKDHGLPPFDAE